MDPRLREDDVNLIADDIILIDGDIDLEGNDLNLILARHLIIGIHLIIIFIQNLPSKFF